MITDVAVVLPVTTPVVDPIEALALLLLHVPPVVASLRAVVLPMHTFVVPVMAAGSALTVTVVVTAHPKGGAI